ncbi:MAG: FHA domain-containing protein [Deltaproteobacteria bacterium]|nr:MAG: FHA domain-containing protein [Deltaproteobacteria bacterium]
MVKLKIKDDEGQTTTVSLTRDEYTVGRKEGNTIRLTAENVSRTHARLLKKGDEVHIEDLSKYGTRVNGERIKTSRRLSDGDVVMIGDYALSLEGAKAAIDEAAAAPAPAAAVDEAPADESLDKQPKPREVTGVGVPSPLEKAAKAQIAAAKAAVSEKTGLATAAVEEKEEKQGRGKGKKRIEASHPMLVAVNSQLAGTTYPITSETMILGRTGENDLQVEHHSISRNHAKIVMKDGKATMVDLQSKNGIRVNGEYWEESILKSGDVIELGKVSFRFVEKGEDFIFRPEDWAGGAFAGSEAADKPEKKGGFKPWILIVLVLLVGGLVAVLVLAGQEPEVNNVPPTTAPPVAETKTPPPETTQPETTPPVPDTPNNAEMVAGALDKAKAAIAAEKWDDADQQVQAVLALDKANAQGQALQKKIATERKAAAAYKAAQEAQAKNDLPAAWEALQGVKDLPADSVYAARVKELRDVVGPAIANAKIDEAKAALGRKRYNEAINLADEALEIVPGNQEAEDVKARARRLLAASKPPTTKPPVTTEPTKAPTTKPPADTGGKTGKDLYMEARKIHNSDPAGALKLYEQAAAKGYSNAYKQIGSVQIQLGNNAAAINAYKRYLSLNPAARDAQTVRDIIVRMGGTP